MASTIFAPAPLTVATLDEWLTGARALPANASVRPTADARVRLGAVLRENITADSYAPHTWEHILGRARRALKSAV